MLDNEPTTDAADTAATDQPTSTRRGAKKTAAATKKTTTTRKRTVKKTAEAVPTQSDDRTADPAPAPAKKAAAKKAAAKKTTVKKAAAKAPAKTTAKRTAKRPAAQDALPELADTSIADAGPVVESAPAKKTTRKRTTKKAAASDLVSTGSPVTDGPVADAEVAPAANADAAGSADAAPGTGSTRKRTSRRRTANTATDAAAAGTSDQVADNATGASHATAQAATDSTGSDPDAAEGTTTRRSRRRPAPAAVLFQAPTADGPQQAPAQAASQQAAATSPVEATPEVAPEQTDDEQPTGPRRRRSRRTRDAESRETETTSETPEEVAAKPVVEATEAEADAQDADGQSDDDEGGDGTRRRRRRRGGRRRRKSGDADGADDSADDQSDDDDNDEQDADSAEADAQSDDETDADEDGDGTGSSSRRRRRRRRRKGEADAGAPDDPDETVVRVREPRSKNTVNEITAVEGSTRLEAKKQRRREGRAAGRRRAPIVTEAEFLARRESVERTMVIRSREDLTQIAVSEDNVLVEHYVTTAEQSSLIGNVYLGRVQNVLPSMEAAFIDIGKGRNAVLYAGEVDWATLGGANGPRKIEQVLKSGQAVLVQVTKDPIGHKGARLTNQISLPGRYVVYVPRGGNGGISRKLPDTERNRLKTILKDIVPDEAGVIVRTAAEGASEEELTADVSRLQKYWEDIDRKSKNGQAPQLLHGEPDLLIRVVRDLFTEDFTNLVISGDDAYDQVREYVSDVAPHLADRVEKWSGNGDVFANFRIDEQIKKALDRKVWLPSGGSLIIDRTEAMTVVDVNTGKFTGSGGNLEETVTKNNLEAAEEIVRQLRLRDIGGIIVIDFIDMVLESNRDLVLRRLVECLGRDRTKHQVAEVTSLGLVQMTRKRIGTGLLEAFSENCDHCGGRGLILHDEPKESRRRDSRNTGNGNGQSNGNGNDQGKQPAAAQAGPSEEGGRKSSRRRRGRNRGEDEQPESPEATPSNGDAAQRLAQIAAASVKSHDDEDHEAEGADVEATAEVERADEAERVEEPAVTGVWVSDGSGSWVATPATPSTSSTSSTSATASTSSTSDSSDAPAAEHGDGSPVGYPDAAAADEHVSPEATGFPAPSEPAEATTAITTEPPEVAAEAADAADAAQNGAKTTRRRRSSRSRSKTATEGDSPEPSELVTTGS
ncbi:Rne/Rng family ribonuclease [Kribbella sp. NPDC026611]|uniref:Rne/Rng family ribonuclease n=1 Tax=Kribbella sp. NPDC026611 TaxID=3154911 RepID=UPI0033FCE016